ncbi:molecular chaperone GrpE, partial [Candidatus Endoriftia persephone str. Guaymas]|nr:molecular chaperone GrpE [Candidatus Endoriftia persephone str. Guaymas]
MEEKQQSEQSAEQAEEMAAPENEAEVVDAESVEVVAEKDLVRLLEDARSKADEHWDALVRARAEIENLRKRHERDLENAHKFALDRFTQDLLQVWDSLELGHQAAQDENVDVARLREGTELTLKLLNDVMSKNQVEQIDPEGEAFNPEFHQAM